jgi:hypothetical protein
MAINVPTFETTKTSLERVSEEALASIVQTPHGMFYYLKEQNPDHVLVSGKRPNQLGVVLYGFEHLGRDVNADELAAQLGLDVRQVTNSLSKLNAIISNVFGMKIERVKDAAGSYTGKLRITNQDDALQASEAYCKKLKSMHTDYVQTLRSYRNNGGNIRDLLAQTANGGALMELVAEVSALPAAAEPVAA